MGEIEAQLTQLPLLPAQPCSAAPLWVPGGHHPSAVRPQEGEDGFCALGLSQRAEAGGCVPAEAEGKLSSAILALSVLEGAVGSDGGSAGPGSLWGPIFCPLWVGAGGAV